MDRSRRAAAVDSQSVIRASFEAPYAFEDESSGGEIIDPTSDGEVVDQGTTKDG